MLISLCDCSIGSPASLPANLPLPAARDSPAVRRLSPAGRDCSTARPPNWRPGELAAAAPAELVRQPLRAGCRGSASVALVWFELLVSVGPQGSGWPETAARQLAAITLTRWLTPGWTPFDAMH